MRPNFTRLSLLLFAGLFALSTCQAANTGHAVTELDRTIELYRAEGAGKTLPDFERLHVLFEQNDDRVNKARAERYMGECHWRLGNYDQSRKHLESALADFHQLGESLGEGKTLNVLGLLEWDLGNYDQAIARFQQASSIGRELGDKRLAGSTMNNLSLVYDEQGDYTTSLRQYQLALELYEGADFARGESDTLGNIGGVNLLLGRYEEALSYYQRALAISETLESKPSMSLDHGNLALCYLGLGQTDTALDHFELAAGLAVETGMRKEQALWLRGKGNALIQKGQYDLGLQAHRDALAIYQDIGARGVLLDALHDMGRMHLMLGDLVSAEQYFQRGTVLASELGVAQAVTANLLALGDLQARRGHLEEAGALYQQSLGRASAAGELNYQAESLLRLSLVHREQQRSDEAESEIRQALAIAQNTGAGPVEAEAWYATGELARLGGETAPALEAYARAQAVAGTGTAPDLLWQIHYGRAQSLILGGERQAAVSELEAAVLIIESVRARLQEERFKAGYVQDKYQVYIALVRLQLELGLTQQAFSTAERLRARSFLDQLETSGPVVRNNRQSQAEFALRERIRQLRSALAQENNMPAPDRRQKAVDIFSSELLASEREYQALLDNIRGQSVIGQAVNTPTLTEVQSQLRPGEALVEYVVGDEQVMIFFMQPGKLSAVTSSPGQSSLRSKVNLVRELLQQPSNDRWRAPAASLSETLIEPLQRQALLEGVHHLYLVPHGILNYLPFAVLPMREATDSPVLLEQFTLSYLPAAAALVREPKEPAVSPSLLALAPERTRLRYALEEARSIAKLYQPQSQLLSGRDATESAFKEQAGSYEILHLSTHGYFNSGNPLLSGLELEADENNDGLLEVHEILGLSLHAGLVTLSACETGMGSGFFNQIPAGDEFVSLTRAFLLAGSRSVMATLWRVDDRSTVEVMEGFYNRLEQGGSINDQAAALAQIQRELRLSKNYSHPFYWAPFVLVGQQGRGSPTLAKRG